MAKVSLRIYNREIETMVDRGQLDEAIAHCRHILNTFPKNLETYRLLGKAYLEARRYDEATDIFERLLMAAPDDFVANVGMSIIRDEQNDLDAAIWQMERAFEVQPSNAAIQAELQRLFGRRDGVEPPKIRLTRGALAHMYLQGELYPQAIAEIKAVLEEDRERQDMQVLLARAYFHAGQKNEAAEICSQLLRRYPYCLDANRVLVELLPETERSESTQVYRQRVNALDPYAAFVSGSIFRSEEVPDAAVSLERLEWDGEPVDLGQDWRESRGIGLADQPTTGDEEPDWLKAGLSAGPFGASIPTEESASVSSSDDDIPDFLREAGWGKDTGAFQEGAGSFEASDEGTEETGLAEGDLPDWIKAMAPSGVDIPASTSPDELEEDLTQDDVPDWLQGLGDAQEPSLQGEPSEEGDIPDWLAAMKPVEETPQAPQAGEETIAEPGEEELPDWISSMQPASEPVQESLPEEESMAEPAGEEELPDWIAEMKPAEAAPQEPQPEESIAGPSGDEELPEWLAAMQPASEQPHESLPEEEPMAEPADEAELPDWIASLKPAEEASQESQPEESMAEPSPEEDIPDWIAALKPAEAAPQELQPQPGQEGIAEPAGDEDLPDWLKSAQPEEQVSAQEMSAETPEEPVQEIPEARAESLSDWQIRDEEAAGPVDFDATDTGTLGTSAGEQEDAIAWLESLASKHGAKPEELVTDPEARKETAPEWVQKAAEAASAAQPPAEEPAPAEEPVEDIPEWIEPASEEPGSLYELEDTQPHKPVAPADKDETGIWLRDLEEEGGFVGEQEPTGEAESQPVDADVPDWLRGMESGVSKAEAEPASEQAPQEIPEWLSEVEETQPSEAAAPASEEEAREVPDWLLGVEATSTEAESLTAAPTEEESSVEPDQQVEFQAMEAAAGSVDEPDFTDWLKSAEPEEVEQAGEAPEEPVLKDEEPDDLPAWLAGLDEKETPAEPPATTAGEDLPDWLRGVDEEQAPVHPEPTASTDWQPADFEAPASEEPLEEATPEPEPVMEEPAAQEEPPAVSEPLSELELQSSIPPEREPYQEPVTQSRSGMTGMLSSAQDPVLTQAQLELTRGNVSGALENYEKLIRKGKMLDEIIFDLREALYRYPVDVSILQSLGDAYMRANRLQDALDAYTKAEELLR